MGECVEAYQMTVIKVVTMMSDTADIKKSESGEQF